MFTLFGYSKPDEASKAKLSSKQEASTESFTYLLPPSVGKDIDIEAYFSGKMDEEFRARALRVPNIPIYMSCSIYPTLEALMNFLSSQCTPPSDKTYILRLGFDSDTVAKLIKANNFHSAIKSAMLFDEVYVHASSAKEFVNSKFPPVNSPKAPR